MKRRLGIAARVRKLSIAGILGLATGCAASSDGGFESAGPRPTTSNEGAASAGVRATIPFKMKNGTVKQVPVEARNGRAYIGDMSFGRLDDMRPRSAGESDIDARWPNGVVRFCMDRDGISFAVQQHVEDAMAYISARVPKIKFVEDDCGLDILEITSNGDPGQTSSASVGYQGAPDMRLGLDAEEPVIRHELGHVLGLFHEQTRSDRDANVEVCTGNVQSDHEFNYDILDADDHHLLAPYDFHSITHYTDTGFIVSNPWPTLCDGKTMRARRDTFPDTFPIDSELGRMDDWTRHDINTVAMMYGERLAAAEAGDRFGAKVAIADFDNDGYDDLVVAATRNAEDFPAGYAYLYFYKGTARGLAPFRILAPPTSENKRGDLFGAALAVGDFDGDGFPDLAVGAPRAAAPGESTRAGLVRIFYGGQWARANYVKNCGADPHCHAGPGGPLIRTQVIRPSAGMNSLTSDDAFGTALVAGHFMHSDRDDLVVGAPGRMEGRGRVYLYAKRLSNGTDFDIAAPTELVSPRCTAKVAYCGSSLAKGDFDDDDRVDLAIGAPSHALDVGRVYVYLNSGLLLWHRQTLAPTLEKGALFGASLVAGHFRNTVGNDNLVVGAPAQMNASGTKAGGVHVYEWQSPAPPSLAQLYPVQTIRSGASVEEHFGQALLAVNVDSPPLTPQELIVGAPTGAAGGRIVMLQRQSGGTLANVQVVSSTEIGFGSSLATGEILGDPPYPQPEYRIRLMVGAPDATLQTSVPTVFAGKLRGYDFQGGDIALATSMSLNTASPWCANP